METVTRSTRVCVFGTGYVGMACCVGLAMLGHRVHGFDIALDRIDRLRRGIAPYQESNIDELLREQIAAGLDGAALAELGIDYRGVGRPLHSKQFAPFTRAI